MNNPSYADLLARISQLEREKANTKSSIKVSVKGAISFYGAGRWPVTLYASQWAIVAENMAKIMAFAETNKSLLAEKPAKETTPEVTA